MRLALASIVLFGTAMFVTGCGTSSSELAAESVTPVSLDASQYLLSNEPDGAIGVIAARQSASDGDPIVVVGRIGGSDNPWIDGRAAFTLLDASKSIVAEGTDSGDGELCTGDCCALERAACTALVKIVDESGRVLAVDSRKLLGVSVNDMVVVQGKAKKDETGNFVLLANGVHVRR